ncbi:MAG TPA: hypothetical protein VKE88_03245 [Candidatus Nanoarchaeia archaeon]|nr:hypothetical protein [Candidatus Nanoarchaeia archaeon]
MTESRLESIVKPITLAGPLLAVAATALYMICTDQGNYPMQERQKIGMTAKAEPTALAYLPKP